MQESPPPQQQEPQAQEYPTPQQQEPQAQEYPTPQQEQEPQMQESPPPPGQPPPLYTPAIQDRPPEASGNYAGQQPFSPAGPSAPGYPQDPARYPQQGPAVDNGWSPGPMPNMGQPMPNMGQPMPNMGQPMPNMGGPMPNMGQPMPNMGGPMPNMGRPMPAPPRNPPKSGAAGVVASILILILMAIIYSVVIFLIIDVKPEYQAQMIIGDEATDAQIRQFISAYDLQESLIIRYVHFMTGNFGYSLTTGQPVNTIIFSRLPTTITLILASLVVTFVFAIPIGIISAVMHNKVADVIFSAISVLCKSVPFFVLALLLLICFSLNLGWLPAGGAVSWMSYILPVVTLGFLYFGFAAQAIRASVIKARSIDNAGLCFPEYRVNGGRVFHSAILPTLAKAGMQLGWLFGGAIIVEQLFALPGIGRMLLDGIMSRDAPVALGGIATLSYCFIIISAIVGLIFAGVFRLLRAKPGK